MGNAARSPDEYARKPDDETDDSPGNLGTRLSGRFADLDIDSVDEVRELRESDE